MAKNQTRRAISMQGEVYERLRLHCEEVGRPMAAVIEELVAESLDAAGVPAPDHVQGKKKIGPRNKGQGSGVRFF